MKPRINKSASRFTLHLSLLLLASLFTLHLSHAQQVICVDASNDTGIENGTQEHPFNTILEGLQFSQNGDSISIMPGNYPEDSILIEKCVSIAGGSSLSTLVEGTFILSSRLDTLPVLIRNLWCMNVNHSDSGFTQTPLIIMDCNLQVMNDYTPSVEETARIILRNCSIDDSIHIENATCAASREVINCETTGGLWLSSSSSQGNIRVADTQVGGSLRVSTISKSDTVFITGNTIADSLVILSTASDPDLISNNQVGGGIRMHAVAHSGFQFTGNQVQQGSLSAKYTALDESVMEYNTFQNGGIDLKAVSGNITIKDNEIHTDGSVAGIRLKTTAGGYFENNTITLPYFEPSGLPLEEDTLSVCAIHVRSTSFGGIRGNQIIGGAYGVYLSAIASNDFDNNEIEFSHFGLYLRSVSAYVDSNRVEYCIGDGMILDYQPEYDDTSAIRLNYNIVRNNGGHGIRTKGNCPMGRLDEAGTGFNVIKDNGGYDLYVETLSSFVDTIWAQNNEWSHSTEEDVGLYDIYDAIDEPSRALVMFSPMLPFGVNDREMPEIVLNPNPTKGKFLITNPRHQTNPTKQIQNIEVADLYGKILTPKNNRTLEQLNNSALVIDISNFTSGTYFIRIHFDNQMIVKKIIKL